MQIIIDGITRKKPIQNDAKVVWENVEATIEDKEVKGQLHLTATSEGIILDFIEDGGTESLFTQSMAVEDILEMMIDNS